MKITVTTLVLLLSSLAQAQAPWTTARTETIPAPAATAGVQQVPLQLVIDETSPWNDSKELRSQLKLTRDSFLPCGIEFGPIELRYVSYSAEAVSALNNSSPYKPPAELVLTQGDQSEARPLVWLFNRQIADTAKAYTRSAVNSLSRTSSVSLEPLLHTSVITGSHVHGDPKLGAAASYTHLAHELAHIMGDLDHVDERNNLMSDDRRPNAKTGRLNPQQCAKIRQYALVNFSQVRDSTKAVESGNLLNAPSSCPARR